MFANSVMLLTFGIAWGVLTNSGSGVDLPTPGLSKNLILDETLEGWVIETLDRHKAITEAATEPIWSVKDGIIRCTGIGGGYLRYDCLLKDFRLELEYRHGPQANSGLSFRAPAFTGNLRERPSRAGYEIQIIDDQEGGPTRLSNGSLYRYRAPDVAAARRPEEWNRMVLVCVGSRIRVFLNGQCLHDIDQRDTKNLAEKPLQGFVALQNHGHRVEYRNIRITSLSR